MFNYRDESDIIKFKKAFPMKGLLSIDGEPNFNRKIGEVVPPPNNTPSSSDYGPNTSIEHKYSQYWSIEGVGVIIVIEANSSNYGDYGLFRPIRKL